MPIYSNEEDREIAKTEDFLYCLKALGAKKLFEQARFAALIKSLRDYKVLISNDLMYVDELFHLMRQMDYDFAGKLLARSYHMMRPKAHRVLNRFSRLMALYATQQ